MKKTCSLSHGTATLTRRRLLIGAVSLSVILQLEACKPRRGAERIRCAFCGMSIAPDSRWQAGARASAGEALHFDTPACLHRYRLQGASDRLREPWVIEYYGPASAHRSALDMSYVQGSTVTGPMGADLIPLEAGNVARFRADHGGVRVLRYDEITAAVINAL
jgi:hypothetical protein